MRPQTNKQTNKQTKTHTRASLPPQRPRTRTNVPPPEVRPRAAPTRAVVGLGAVERAPVLVEGRRLPVKVVREARHDAAERLQLLPLWLGGF